MAQYVPLAVAVAPLLERAPAIIDGFADSAGKFWEKYLELTSNAPGAKFEALKEYRKSTEEAHKASMGQMEEMNQRLAKTATEQEEAADRRLREQREENNEVLEVLRGKIREREQNHSEHMKKMNNEHATEMKKIQSETKESREKAEEKHKEKMAVLEKQHKEEKKQAEEKLEKAKSDGEAKIKEAKEEKEAITKQRNDALTEYNQKMRELTNENDKVSLKLRGETSDLKIQNCKQRRLQLEESNRLTLDQIQQQTNQLRNHLRLETNRELVTMFQSLMIPMKEINSSLGNVVTKCLPNDSGLDVEVAPGALDPDFQSMRAQKALYNSRLRTYEQFVTRANHVQPEVYSAFQKFITTMTQCVEKQELSSLIAHLPTAIDKDRYDVVAKYGNSASDLKKQFDALCVNVDATIKQLTTKHLHEGNVLENGNLNPRAIEK